MGLLKRGVRREEIKRNLPAMHPTAEVESYAALTVLLTTEVVESWPATSSQRGILHASGCNPIFGIVVNS
jgi:hypothetical protein